MGGLPERDRYLDDVLLRAAPGSGRLDDPAPSAAWRLWWAARRGPTDGLTRVLHRQGFVVTSAQLAAYGFTRQQARTALAKREWSRPAYGVITPVDVRDAEPSVELRRRHALAAAAAALRQPGHVVSGRSAAILHGLPVLAVPNRPEVTDPARNGLGRNGNSHVHGAGLTAAELAGWFGVPVTAIARTVVDLARHDRRDGLMAADAALRAGLVTPADITTALDDAAGWPGVRQARGVLALAEPRAESPLESLVRLALHDDGFPVPELQVWLGEYRVDMLFRAQRLVLEIDGLQKYSADALRREKRRERRLRALGYRVERVTWDEVVRDWPATRRWLRPALGLPD